MASANYPGGPPFSNDAQAAIAAEEYRVILELRKHVVDAAKKGLMGHNNRIQKLASALALSGTNNPAVLKANRAIAEKMHIAVKNAFRARVENKKRVASYRVGKGRLSGGALKRAVFHESQVKADGTGITYINQKLLNSEARHWARLNFGAGAAGAKTVQRRTYDLTFGGTRKGGPSAQGTKVKKVGFGSLHGARPPFFMPLGIWGTEDEQGRIGKGTQRPGSLGRRRFKNTKGNWVGGAPIGNASFRNDMGYGNRRGGRGRFAKRNNAQFFPLGTGRFYNKPTIGIRAANFFNDGFAALVKEFPREYYKMYDTWVKQKKAQGQVIKRTAVKIRGGQPVI